jgi:anthranilate/para-aminobenzoate synthase component I
MNTIPALLESYCNSLITQKLPYEAAKTIRTEQLPHEPAVWIPRWPLSSETVFEVIGYALAAYIKIDSNKAYLTTAHGETELFVNDPYEIITEIDTHWACDLFYPGLLSYDLGPPELKSDAPGAQKIFYDLPFFLALFLKEGYYIDHSAHSVTYFKSTLAALPSQPAKNNTIRKFPLQAESFEQYKQKIKAIRRFIEEGEIYQLNYTLRFSARCTQSGYDFFKVLYGINPAPFSFYIRMPSFVVSKILIIFFT